MTEQDFAFRIRRSLDESTERLPYRVSHRLGAAREAALARMGAAPAAQAAPVAAVRSAAATLAGGGGSRWRSVALAIAPILLLAAGALSIPFWDDSQKAAETADLDEAVLTDDLPISAYADRGFGVYLRNSRQ